MVELKFPVKLKVLECKLAILFKLLMVRFSKRELLDTEKIITIRLKREESIVLMDRDDNLWELFKNKKGRHSLKNLKENRYEARSSHN